MRDGKWPRLAGPKNDPRVRDATVRHALAGHFLDPPGGSIFRPSNRFPGNRLSGVQISGKSRARGRGAGPFEPVGPGTFGRGGSPARAAPAIRRPYSRLQVRGRPMGAQWIAAAWGPPPEKCAPERNVRVGIWGLPAHSSSAGARIWLRTSRRRGRDWQRTFRPPTDGFGVACFAGRREVSPAFSTSACAQAP